MRNAMLAESEASGMLTCATAAVGAVGAGAGVATGCVREHASTATSVPKANRNA
jgi:hypothetical protein